MIAFGVEKVIEAKILSSGFFDITRVEQYLLQTTETPTVTPTTAATSTPVSSVPTTTPTIPLTPAPRQGVSKSALPISAIGGQPAWVPANAPLYHEIVAPAGFVNTNDQPIHIADYVGKKVVLLDVMTYSCINCQRTFPYVVSWYGKYKDQGLIVIGIHTPEFAFEKDKHNVEEAMKRFGITFPIVLDNDYGTWNAYGNRFWPRKYLIDIHGKVVFDHIGEGGYEEMEMKIRDLLAERASVLGEQQSSNQGTLSASSIVAPTVAAGSPETYFGAGRNQYLENGVPGQVGQQNVVLPQEFALNKLYLGGSWMFADESAQASAGAKVVYRYNAKQVYLVASALADTAVEVWQDGQRLTPTVAGGDVKDGRVTVRESRLYSLVNNQAPGEHVLELRFPSAGASLYTFTFG
jgi:thiol-disulfide isomerase/thioredoxin